MAGKKDGGEGLGEDSTGTTVKLHGLEDKSHLNGRIGCVVKALAGNRYQVNLAAGPAGAEKMVSVKGKNLRILQTYTMIVYLVKHGRVNFPLPQPSDLLPADYAAIQEEAQKIAEKTGCTKMALQFCNTQRDMRVISMEMRADGLLGGTVAYELSQPRRLLVVCQGCWQLVQTGSELKCSRCGIASYCSTRCMKTAKSEHEPMCKKTTDFLCNNYFCKKSEENTKTVYGAYVQTLQERVFDTPSYKEWESRMESDEHKKVCCGCGKTHAAEAAKMLKCDRCAVARFCSQQCQQSNWREHRKECFFATKEMLNAFRCPEMVVQTIDDPEELKPLPHDEGGQLHAKAIQRHRIYKNAQHLKDDDFEFQRQIRQCSRLAVEEAAGWAAVRDHVGAALAYQSGAMMHKAAGHVDMVQRMAELSKLQLQKVDHKCPFLRECPLQQAEKVKLLTAMNGNLLEFCKALRAVRRVWSYFKAVGCQVDGSAFENSDNT